MEEESKLYRLLETRNIMPGNSIEKQNRLSDKEKNVRMLKECNNQCDDCEFPCFFKSLALVLKFLQ